MAPEFLGNFGPPVNRDDNPLPYAYFWDDREAIAASAPRTNSDDKGLDRLLPLPGFTLVGDIGQDEAGGALVIFGDESNEGLAFEGTDLHSITGSTRQLLCQFKLPDYGFVGFVI